MTTKSMDLGQVMGTSAYQEAQAGGYTGTKEDFQTQLAELPNHIADKENPHGVTAAEVGAVTMAEVNSAIQTAIGNAIGGSY